MPCGQKDQWDACSFVVVQRVGNGNDIHARNGNQFAVASIHQVPQDRELTAHILPTIHAFLTVIAEDHGREQHALAFPQITDIGTKLLDFARDITAVNVWELYSR